MTHAEVSLYLFASCLLFFYYYLSVCLDCVYLILENSIFLFYFFGGLPMGPYLEEASLVKSAFGLCSLPFLLLVSA